jgi:urocanate hydratase
MGDIMSESQPLQDGSEEVSDWVIADIILDAIAGAFRDREGDES